MRSTMKTSVVALLAGAALVLGACTGNSTPTPSSGVPAASTTAATGTQSTPVPADGSSPAQDPASSFPGSETAGEPTVMSTSASVALYFIAEGDAGISGPTVGCGDSAIAVSSQTITYTDPVEAALRTLLANHAPEIGQSGLRNALSESRLGVDSVVRSGNIITANLSGTLSLGGECDIPRVEQQLLLTAKQAAGSPVAITINGKTLNEALSLK